MRDDGIISDLQTFQLIATNFFVSLYATKVLVQAGRVLLVDVKGLDPWRDWTGILVPVGHDVVSHM